MISPSHPSPSNAAAKPLVAMQAPLPSLLPLIRQGKIHAFSANPVLYKDLSLRVIQTLQQFSAGVEQYSIDEAFLNLKGFNPTTLADPVRPIGGVQQPWLEPGEVLKLSKVPFQPPLDPGPITLGQEAGTARG